MASNLSKKDIRKKICESSKSLESLKGSININDYLGVNIPEDKTIMYGVNVQLKGDADIMPFIFCTKKGFDPMEVVKAVSQDNFKVPNFLREFEIKDILFSCDICLSESLSIANMSVMECKNMDGEDKEVAIKKLNLGKIVEWLNNTYSFLIQNLIALDIKDKTKCYVWISGEDYDPESGGASTMSNILAISDEENSIKSIREKRTDIVDFLFLLKSKYLIEIAKKNKWEALKSAVSAIMSRNMSHNLGSHYLYYTKTYLESLANKSGDNGPDIRGTAKVLGYTQSRMDYLATIISNDKYPSGSVNFKSQIYDELTIDDFSKRHFTSDQDKPRRTTNFLLSHLILSENFSRPNIFDNDGIREGQHMPLILQTILRDNDESQIFTGTSITDEEAKIIAQNKGIDINIIPTLEREENVKDKLSKLNLALPGGTMSCHAFFNVLENFIRNSAKYLQDDFKNNCLLITIAIQRNRNDKSKLDFIIYDNKQNANKLMPAVKRKSKTLLQNINEQLSNLQILEEDNSIEKSSKGLKEMLFSSVWMRTYTYPGETFTDIINKINIKKKGKRKLQLINKYGFSVVPVSYNGEIVAENAQNANLGIMFTLPEFQQIANLNISDSCSENSKIEKSLGVYADIVEFNEEPKKNSIGLSYLDFFTRTYIKSSFNEVAYNEFIETANVKSEKDDISLVAYKFKSILDKRFQHEIKELRASATETQEKFDIDSFQLAFGGDIFEGEDILSPDRQIYFKRHLNSQEDDLTIFFKNAYADTVSGGNFTITLNSLIAQGLDDEGHYLTWSDKLFGLKVKESALTRITLIDERLYNNMADRDVARMHRKETELSLKNIRILNYSPNLIKRAKKLSDIFEGNTFKDKENRTHFLSIHLGLIEKIVKNERIIKKFLGHKLSLEQRVKKFMELLAKEFSDNGTKVYISVHSGRGNFSKELEGPLATYPFINLSSIENAYSNSKYLLSQLFYNTIYIGKGRINNKKK